MEQEAAAPDPYRVLVVDDRPEIRLLVRTRLRMLDDIEVVGEASNGEEALRAEASIDALTRAYLRGPGHVELEREIVRARRTGKPLVLAFMDVDGLKAVNDSHGHAAGDRLLRDVAAVLRDQSRDYDVIVRHGGDEFLLAIPEMTMDQARERMELIQAALSSFPNHRSVSVGLALLEDEDTLETLIERADDELSAVRSSEREPR